MTTTTITSCIATIVDGDRALTAGELAHVCGTQIDWVVRIVEAGVVHAPEGSGPESWRFQSTDLRRALEARRLERALDATPDAAALILDMGREIRRLKAVLRAHGLDVR